MSRSGYSDCLSEWALICWRGAVASAIRGKRGQQLLREMAAALDAMPVKRLIAGDLVRNGEVCALGAVGLARGMQMASVDPEDREQVAKAFDIAEALAAEISYMNDESIWFEPTPEKRWEFMRQWVSEKIGEAR